MVLVPSALRRRSHTVQTTLHVPGAGKPIAPPLPQAAAVGASDKHRLHVVDRTTGLKFLVDTGSAVSLLPRSFVKRSLQPTALKLSAANSTTIDTYGAHRMDLDLRLRRSFPWQFIIADVCNPILGADFLAHFGLVVDMQRQRIIDLDSSLHAVGSVRPAEVHSVDVIISADVAEGIFADLLRKYNDLATPGSTTIALTGLDTQHHIVTTGPPAAAKARRLLGPRLEAAKAEFRILMEMGIVRLSDSSWASPLRLVLKPDGTYRITGDYRQLNSRTVPDRYPLPIIEDLLLSLGGSIFSVIDLKKAFYQLPLAPEYAHKTAIITPFGLFEFTRSSLGLRNAAQSLQRAMDQLLRDLPFARAYLDDIIVASSSAEEHVSLLKALFDVLQAANIKVNPDKCVLGK